MTMTSKCTSYCVSNTCTKKCLKNILKFHFLIICLHRKMFKICLSFSFRPHFATRYTHFISSDFSKNFRRTHSFGFLGGYKQALFVVVKKENLLLMKWNLSFFLVVAAIIGVQNGEKKEQKNRLSVLYFFCVRRNEEWTQPDARHDNLRILEFVFVYLNCGWMGNASNFTYVHQYTRCLMGNEGTKEKRD